MNEDQSNQYQNLLDEKITRVAYCFKPETFGKQRFRR